VKQPPDVGEKAATPPPSRVRPRDDDNDDGGDAPTPHAAGLVVAAERSAALRGGERGPVPPLAEGDLMGLLERFTHLTVAGGLPLLVHNSHMFDPASFVNRAHANLERHALKMETEAMTGSSAPINVIARPAFDHVVWYARLDAYALDQLSRGGKLELYSVCTKSMSSLMASRGFTKVTCTHLGDDLACPPSIHGASMIDGRGDALLTAAEKAGLVEGRFDGKVRPYTGKPNELGKQESTPAAQLVREFESYVYSDSLQEYFSPYYLFTKAMRTSVGFVQAPGCPTTAFADTFAQRCRMYVYLREGRKGELMSDIDMKYGGLRTATSSYFSEKAAAEAAAAVLTANAAEASGSGKAVKKCAKKSEGDWYDRAALIAARYVSAPADDDDE
jgi:hypothetical protein